MKRCLTLLLALVLALSLAACGAKSAGPDTMTGDYNCYESAKEDYDFSATDDEPEGAGAWNGDGQVGSGIDKSLSERGVKMIYSAHIEMQTLSYEQAVEDIAALVERSGAYFERRTFRTIPAVIATRAIPCACRRSSSLTSARRWARSAM